MNDSIDLYFYIRSEELQPDDVSSIVGLNYDSCCVKGDKARQGQTPYKENVWKIKSPSSDGESMEAQVNNLIVLLKPVESKLKDIFDRCSFDVECVIHLYNSTTTPIINFNVEAVRFFSGIGAELGVDVYCFAE